jgi:hypothetical protein
VDTSPGWLTAANNTELLLDYIATLTLSGSGTSGCGSQHNGAG